MQYCCLIFGEREMSIYTYVCMTSLVGYEKIKNRKENLSRRQKKKLVMGKRVVDRCFSSLSFLASSGTNNEKCQKCSEVHMNR